MHEVLLENYCPAFGLLPDLAMLVLYPPFGETAFPPDHHWTLGPPPATVDAAHEPNFVFDILQRIQAQINRPVVVSHNRKGRRILEVLGCYFFLEQKNKCWRVYEWKYESLGLINLIEAPAQNIVAQAMPWRWQWLQSLAPPIALEYANWRLQRVHAPNMAAVKRCSQWLVQVLDSKLKVTGLRAKLSTHLALDPWTLKIASRFLRSHDTPQKVLLADYNCIMARRSVFAKLEADAHHLISLYGALCRARKFPATGEPVQQLKK